jgi:CRISPR-associated protein (TIGR02710 family)
VNEATHHNAGLTPADAPRQGKVLVLTVGEGTVEKLEETVVTPFRKSFEQGEWEQIVLLPSKKTEANARLLEERFPQFPLLVRALRKEKDEDNTDACFRHFDEVLERLLADGWRREDITADVTRGTKAMTAALAMTAMAHRVGCIRYITGERDERGMVKPGTEHIIDVPPQRALQRQDVNLAGGYMRAGNYRAVEALFPGAPARMYEGHLKEEIRWLGWAAKFWGAWDRFDYKEAARLARMDGMPREAPAAVREFLPSEPQQQVLSVLAGAAPPEAGDNVGYCRTLAADLIANAERRLREGQNEEVLVRLYRVLELLGQMRLFAHGIDSASVDPDDSRVQAWLSACNPELRKNRDGRYELARKEAACLLLHIETCWGEGPGLELARKLAQLDWLGEWGPTMRNTSLLIHGFRARSRGRERELAQLMTKLTELYCNEGEGDRALLDACRFQFLQAIREENLT